MIDFMNRITDKAGWEKKAYNESITAKWRLEAPATPNVDISDKMIDWVSASAAFALSAWQPLPLACALEADLACASTLYTLLTMFVHEVHCRAAI